MFPNTTEVSLVKLFSLPLEACIWSCVKKRLSVLDLLLRTVILTGKRCWVPLKWVSQWPIVYAPWMCFLDV